MRIIEDYNRYDAYWENKRYLIEFENQGEGNIKIQF